MKKILLISVRSDHGGGPQHMRDLAKGLKTQGHQVFIAAPSTPPYGPEYKELANEYIELTHRKFSLISCFQLFKLCHRENPLIHSHGFGASLYTIVLALLGYKCLHTFHGLHETESLLKSLLIRFSKNLFQKTICVSRDEKNVGLKNSYLIKDKNVVINNGINTLKRGRDDQRFQRPDHFHLGCLTRFDPHKNNLFLLEAMTQLPEDVFLSLAGDGPERIMLENFVVKNNLQQRVSFFGFIDRPLDFLHNIDLFVSSSRGEGLPYALLEAMVEKKPLLVSRVPGHSGLISDDDLFDLENREQFLSKVIQKKEAPTTPNYETFLSNFSLEKNLNQLIELYQEIAVSSK